MYCNYCGEKDDHNSQFCMKCGMRIRAGASETEGEKAQTPAAAAPAVAAFAARVLPKGRRGLAISIAVSVVLLAVIILILVLSANPVAGKWYAQDGTELIFLRNGKGMTTPENEADRVHFMYAVEYKESGYIEGEIYEKAGGPGSWFYLYDGKLEFDGETFYRSQYSARMG